MTSSLTNRSNKPKAANLQDWLARDPNFSGLIQEQSRLLNIQAAIQAGLKQQFPRLSLQVAKADQHLTLLVNGAASAAKLRQLEPELLSVLREGGWEFSRIKVRPQTVFQHTPQKMGQPRTPLNNHAMTELNNAAQTMTNPKLKQALTSILKNQQKRTKNLP
jgi:hypothetical protein